MARNETTYLPRVRVPFLNNEVEERNKIVEEHKKRRKLDVQLCVMSRTIKEKES